MSRKIELSIFYVNKQKLFMRESYSWLEPRRRIFSFSTSQLYSVACFCKIHFVFERSIFQLFKYYNRYIKFLATCLFLICYVRYLFHILTCYLFVITIRFNKWGHNTNNSSTLTIIFFTIETLLISAYMSESYIIVVPTKNFVHSLNQYLI